MTLSLPLEHFQGNAQHRIRLLSNREPVHGSIYREFTGSGRWQYRDAATERFRWTITAGPGRWRASG